MSHRITNFDELNTGELREHALTITESAYKAIDTDTVIRSQVQCVDDVLSVGGRTYNLKNFAQVRVVGFGKASCKAAETVESILHKYINEGAVIDVRPGTSNVITISEGTHPKPSPHNAELTGTIVDMAGRSEADDLVIVIVSGGGSSLLCWPIEECDQATRLYDDILGTGATIQEMNTVRKHISKVKGGGLAELLYPATVVGLIFCDVPGDRYDEVASGPTYMDTTTIADARAILDRYHLSGYTVEETPKDPRFFENVHNVALVSNVTALDAMEKAAADLGYEVVRAGSALYDTPKELVTRMNNLSKPKTAVIGAGEASLTVTHKGGKGGRCQYIALQSLAEAREDTILIAFASDGIDNSPAAGAIADLEQRTKVIAAGFSIEDRLADCDTYGLFEATGGLIFTGKTDANVSDLFLLLRS